MNANLTKASRFGLAGAVAGLVSAIFGEAIYKYIYGETLISVLLGGVFWFGFLGLFLTAFLMSYLAVYFHSKPNWNLIVILSLKSGFSYAALVGGFAEYVFRIYGGSEPLRLLVWSLASGLIGLVVSIRIPNLSIVRGIIGGAFGGFMGCLLWMFVTFFVVGDQGGRLIGCMVIGFMIGMMLVFADNFGRAIWLEIAYGPQDIVNISLGIEPIILGSDSKICTVYIEGVLPQAVRFWKEGGVVYYQEITSSLPHPASSQFSRLYGNALVSVKEA